MDAPNIKTNTKNELRDKIADFLRMRDWFVLTLHSNGYQYGLPNMFATHKTYRSRWIHAKGNSQYTSAQLESFPKMLAFGSGVWVLTGADNSEYTKLWKPSNWHEVKHYGKIQLNKAPVIPESVGPEREIQEQIKRTLKANHWYVVETHGNLFSRGLPDLFATHSVYGGRWIEIKNPDRYSFTAAQLETFPEICKHGSGVWVLGSIEDIPKLLLPSNWHWWLIGMNQRSANIPRINSGHNQTSG